MYTLIVYCLDKQEEDVKNYLPDYVINHGVLKVSKLSELLQDSKVRNTVTLNFTSMRKS